MTAVAFVGSGFVLIPPNATAYRYIPDGPTTAATIPGELSSGLHWIDPAFRVDILRLPYAYPSTDNFIAMALYYDRLWKAEIAAGHVENPRTERDVRIMAHVIERYLRRMGGVVLPTFEFNGIEFYRPEKNDSRYQVEMAYWRRVMVDNSGEAIHDESGDFVPDNRIYINALEYHRFLVNDDSLQANSFMGLLTHEMVHGFAIPVSSLKWSVREL